MSIKSFLEVVLTITDTNGTVGETQETRLKQIQVVLEPASILMRVLDMREDCYHVNMQIHKNITCFRFINSLITA